MFKGDIDRPSAYEGPRDEAGIIKYLKKQVRPSVLEAAPPAAGRFAVPLLGRWPPEESMHASADCVPAQLRRIRRVLPVCTALCGRQVSVPACPCTPAPCFPPYAGPACRCPRRHQGCAGGGQEGVRRATWLCDGKLAGWPAAGVLRALRCLHAACAGRATCLPLKRHASQHLPAVEGRGCASCQSDRLAPLPTCLQRRWWWPTWAARKAPTLRRSPRWPRR